MELNTSSDDGASGDSNTQEECVDKVKSSADLSQPGAQDELAASLASLDVSNREIGSGEAGKSAFAVYKSPYPKDFNGTPRPSPEYKPSSDNVARLLSARSGKYEYPMRRGGFLRRPMDSNIFAFAAGCAPPIRNKQALPSPPKFSNGSVQVAAGVPSALQTAAMKTLDKLKLGEAQIRITPPRPGTYRDSGGNPVTGEGYGTPTPDSGIRGKRLFPHPTSGKFW